MTLPFIPNSGYLLAQALGKGLGMADEAHQAAIQQQRERDLQNIQLWSQLMPSLTSLTPGVGEAPEVISTPKPPAPIAQSLMRMTGQPNIGINPAALSQMRENALAGATFAARAKQPALQNQQAEQGLALGEIRLKGDQYDLSTKPAKDAAVYALSVAPTYVNAAISAGVMPTRANASKLVDQAYKAFKENDRSAWAPTISKEMFAKAVGDEVDELEKFGLAQYNSKTARMNAAQANDPMRRVEAAADNYRGLLGYYSQERARLIGTMSPLDQGAMMNPKGRSMMTPAGQSAMKQIDEIDKLLPSIVQRQQTMQNILDKSIGVEPMTQAPQPGSSRPPTYSVDEMRAGLSALSNPQAIQSTLLLYNSRGMLTKEDALALADEYRKKGVRLTLTEGMLK